MPLLYHPLTHIISLRACLHAALRGATTAHGSCLAADGLGDRDETDHQRQKGRAATLGRATLALVVAVVTLLTVLIGCAQHEGASTPQGLPTQHARVRAVLRSREGSLPNQKRSSGDQPELCVSRLSFGVQEEPPIGYRSGSGPASTLRALVSEALTVMSTSVGQSSRV